MGAIGERLKIFVPRLHSGHLNQTLWGEIQASAFLNARVVTLCSQDEELPLKLDVISPFSEDPEDLDYKLSCNWLYIPVQGTLKTN